MSDSNQAPTLQQQVTQIGQALGTKIRGFYTHINKWIKKEWEFNEDKCGWSRDIATYAGGEFSMASIQANNDMQDYCQVETGGSDALFLGVYDGHYSTAAADYVSKNLFSNLISTYSFLFH